MPLNTTDTSQIENFVEAMWLEKGLSENTLSAYRSDLSKFANYLALQIDDGKSAQLLDFDQNQLHQYLATRYDEGLSERSTS